MYGILIVDDDKLIRQHIKTILDWEKNDFKIVAEADNGSAALELLKTEAVSLVVTDIYMPVMDGVELIKRAKAEYPHIEFVVISNYDEFKYVREAMRYGAFDYFLKYEIDAEGFLSIIHAVKRTLDKRSESKNLGVLDMNDTWKHTLEEKFWNNVLSGRLDSKTTLSEAANLKIELHSAAHVLLLVDAAFINMDIRASEAAEEALDMLLPSYVNQLSEEFKYNFVLKLQRNMWVVILRVGEKSCGIIKNACINFSRTLLKQIKSSFNAGIVIEIGEIIFKNNEFSHIYDKMRRLIENKFYYGLDVVLDITYLSDFKYSLDGTCIDELKAKMLNHIVSFDFESAQKYLVLITEEINRQKLSPDIVYELFTVLLLTIRKTLGEKGVVFYEDKGIPVEKKIRSIKTLKSVEIFLGELFQEADNQVHNANGCKYRREIQKALTYIKKNYMKNLTLEHISEYAGISRNYFCKVFKEETGENFIEYLNKLRIEQAKQLISDSDKSMKEISSLVGMDYAYFCKVFKIIVGKRPSDLREL